MIRKTIIGFSVFAVVVGLLALPLFVMSMGGIDLVWIPLLVVYFGATFAIAAWLWGPRNPKRASVVGVGHDSSVGESNPTVPPWRGIVCFGLLAAALLMIASAVIQVFGFHGVVWRDRLFAMSQQIGLIPTLLALAAVIIVLTGELHPRRAKSVRSWSTLIAVIAVLSAVYSAGYALLVHQHFPPIDASTAFAAIISTNGAYRGSAVLEAAAVFTLAVVVLVTAQRIGANGPRPNSFVAWLNSERATHS